MKSDDVAGRTKVYESHRARRRRLRGRHPRKLQRAGQGDAFARPQRRAREQLMPRAANRRHAFGEGRGRQPLPIASSSSLTNWKHHEPGSPEYLQSGGRRPDLRPDPHLALQPREDPLLVVRRDQEARDHQLPDVQARARRPVLRAHLRPDQGLRVPVRQVQAHEVQGHHLRKVRRRGHPGPRPARADGPHRTGLARRPHLVPEVAAQPHRHDARHAAQGHRAGPVFRILHRHRAGPDQPQAAPAAVGRRVSALPGGVRRRQLHRRDRRRGHPGPAQGDRPGRPRPSGCARNW